MNLKKTALVVSALLVLFAFSGCSKKPRRPNPMDTVMADGGYDSSATQGGGINPVAMDDAARQGLSQRNVDQNGPWIDRAQAGIYPTIYFSFDSSSLAPKERATLDNAISRLKSNPGDKLLLVGHCDWRGTTEYNLALGDRRSKAVQEYITRNLNEPGRLQTLSKGDEGAPEGASSAQMAKDRRVDLLVVH